MNNVIATIYIQKLTATDKYEYVLMASGVRVLLSPASITILGLYPDLPVGQTFNYSVIKDNSMTLSLAEFTLPPQSKLVITSSEVNSIKANDVFITKEAAQIAEIGGQDVFNGLAVKQP